MTSSTQPQTNQSRDDPTAALAALLGVAVGMLTVRGLLEREELAAIFSLADANSPGGTAALSILETDGVQTDMRFRG